VGGIIGGILAKILKELLQIFLQRHDFRQRVLAEVKGTTLEGLLLSKEWETAALQHPSGGGTLRVRPDGERIESFESKDPRVDDRTTRG